MKKDCLLCGVGGQGTVRASRIIALSGMEEGYNVKTAETIGMAQRGGSVVSHVRISDAKIWSPLIPKGAADVLIAFEPAEAVRCLDFLKPDGAAIVNSRAVKPVEAMLGNSAYDGTECLEYLRKHVKNLRVIDGEEICRQCGSARVLNIVLLAGAAATGELGISVDGLKDAIRRQLAPKYHEMNLRAVDLVAGNRA